MTMIGRCVAGFVWRWVHPRIRYHWPFHKAKQASPPNTISKTLRLISALYSCSNIGSLDLLLRPTMWTWRIKSTQFIRLVKGLFGYGHYRQKVKPNTVRGCRSCYRAELSDCCRKLLRTLVISGWHRHKPLPEKQGYGVSLQEKDGGSVRFYSVKRTTLFYKSSTFGIGHDFTCLG